MSAATDRAPEPVTSDGHLLDDAASDLMHRVRAQLGRSLPLAFVVTDPRRADNPIVFVNDAFEAITGYPPEETLGRNCRFLQPEGTQSTVRARLRTAIERREPVVVEIGNRRRDGTTFRNRLMVSPLFSEKGDVIAYLGIQYEIEPGDR